MRRGTTRESHRRHLAVGHRKRRTKGKTGFQSWWLEESKMNAGQLESPSPLPLSPSNGERGGSLDAGTQGGARGLADPGLICGTPLGFSDQSLVASASKRLA